MWESFVEIANDLIDIDLLVGLTAAFYLIAIRNTIRILRQDLSPAAALAWILVNLGIPFLGVPLYFFLGQSKVIGYVKRRFKKDQILEDFEAQPDQPRWDHREFQKLKMFEDSLTKLDEGFLPLPGDVRLMLNGEQAFPEIFSAINEAKHYILAQSYILRQDRLGMELKELLSVKAQNGVKVYLLIDDWGSFGLGRKYVRALRKAGVKVARFLPLGLRFNVQMNFRNHRKLVLIDGVKAFTGGLNWGVEYLGRHQDKLWRDTHLQLTGPCVTPLIHTFIHDWNFAAGVDLTETLTQPFPLANQGMSPVQVVSFGPGDDRSAGLALFYQAISQATSELIIASPYFIPDTILENALVMARLRGVKVKVLIPQQGDSGLVHLVTLVHAEALAGLGIDFHLYEDGFMHQKVMLVDRSVAILGTSNFDNRSMYLNFETSILVHGKEVCDEVYEMLEEDFAKAQPFENSGPLKRYHQGIYRFFRLMGPLF